MAIPNPFNVALRFLEVTLFPFVRTTNVQMVWTKLATQFKSKIGCYLCQGDMFSSLFVGLFVSNFEKNFRTDLHEVFRVG